MRFEKKGLPNFSVRFTDRGMVIRVSLNIEPQMAKHLYPWVDKGGFYHVHCLEEEIFEVNKVAVKNVYQRLLNQIMVNCRKAKQKVLEEQINGIEYKQTKLNL